VALLIVAVLVLAVGLGFYAFYRAWQGVRDQGQRMRRDGGPRGADFDDFLTRKLEQMPVAGGCAEPAKRSSEEQDAQRK
jgi:hypothetical protein